MPQKILFWAEFWIYIRQNVLDVQGQVTFDSQMKEGKKKQVSTTVYRFFLLLLPGHVFMDITDTGDVVWTLRTGDISLCMRPRRRLVHHGGTNNLWYENVPTVQNTAGARNNTFHMLALAKYTV